jgi:hypothetical protein
MPIHYEQYPPSPTALLSVHFRDEAFTGIYVEGALAVEHRRKLCLLAELEVFGKFKDDAPPR